MFSHPIKPHRIKPQFTAFHLRLCALALNHSALILASVRNLPWMAVKSAFAFHSVLSLRLCGSICIAFSAPNSLATTAKSQSDDAAAIRERNAALSGNSRASTLR